MVKPILRFIDQPYRHVAGDSVVFGLASASINGISSVQVTVSDGVNPDVVGSVSSATWNIINDDWAPSCNVTLDLTGLNDGPVTVTALATDGGANTRSIAQTVNNNSGGTLGDYDACVAYVSPTGNDGTGAVNNRSLPFATIAAAQAAAAVAKGTQYDPGACSVLLEAGGYTWGDYAWGTRISGQTDWLRIAPAPGVTREQARITGTHTYGIGVGLFWLDGISIELNQTTFAGGLRFQSSAVSEVLLTNCSGYDADNPGEGAVFDNRIFQNNGTAHQYVIGGTYTNIRKGFGADLVRGVTYGRLGEDVCSSALCVLNITFETITRDDGSWHPDVYQFDVSSPNENIFVFGIRGLDADCQMLFQGDGQTALKDAAFINVMLATDGSYVSQFESGADHLLIWHCHIGQTMRFETESVTLTDVSILNSYVESLQAMVGGSIAALEAAATIDHLSQGDDGGVGTNPIAGSTTTWEDAAGGDYRLLSTDPGYEACPAIAELDYLDGSRAARNATTPDAGPFLDAADPTVGFGESPSTPSYAWPAKPAVPLLKLDTADSRSVGLLGAWAFSEGSGSKVRDASGRGNDISVSASHSWVEDGCIGRGLTGSASAFSDSPAGVFPESESCSVSILFSSGDPATSDYFLDLGFSTGSGSGVLLYSHTSDAAGSARLGWKDTSGSFEYVLLDGVLDGNAHCVELSFDGSAGRAKVFVDGNEVSDEASSLGPFGSAGGVARFQTYVGSDLRVYDAKLWNRALTEAEIQAEWTDSWGVYKSAWLKPSSFVLNTADSRAGGLRMFLAMEEGSGTTIRDVSGNGFDVPSFATGDQTWTVDELVGPGILLGTNTQLVVPPPGPFNIDTNEWAVSLLLRRPPTIVHSYSNLFLLVEDSGGNGYIMLTTGATPSGDLSIYLSHRDRDGNGSQVGGSSTPNTFTLGDLHVVVVMRSASGDFTIHHSALTETVTSNQPLADAYGWSGRAEIGGVGSDTDTGGTLFGVKLWNRALTEAEIEAEYVDPWGLGMGPAAPTLTVTDSLDGRTLTITVDSLEGSPPPTAALTTLTLDGCDVRDQATGSGPWVYEIPASTDTHTVAWGVTATNSEGTAIASGSEVVDGGSSTAPSFTVESSASLDGRQITITPGVATGSPSPTLSIAATLDSVPITMTGSGPWTYDVPSSSAAQLLEWVVTATNSAGSDTSVGNITIDEDLFAPAIEGLPWVVGAAVSGQTLVATAAPATGTPTPTRSWQWYRAPSTAIAGATSSSYTLQVADEGLQVFVRQTETNSEGSDTADSAATVLVTAPVVSSRRPLLGLGRLL